jgi:anti-anti-sigma factor
MTVNSLQVSVAYGESGPVLVLAGEADLTSITRLDEALTAQVSGPAVQLTIDATNLRFADSASVRTLAVAAMRARTQSGSVILLNPQPQVVRVLDLLCVDEVFAIRGRIAGEARAGQ